MEKLSSRAATLVVVAVLVLVAVNMYTGATLRKVGIPGIFEFEFDPRTTPVPPPPPPVNLTGKYLMDPGNFGRVIMVTHLGGDEYSLEENTGSWPWAGRATLTGNNLIGNAKFKNDLGTMRLEGFRTPSGDIDINYVYLTDASGKPFVRPSDHHVWSLVH